MFLIWYLSYLFCNWKLSILELMLGVFRNNRLNGRILESFIFDMVGVGFKLLVRFLIVNDVILLLMIYLVVYLWFIFKMILFILKFIFINEI